MNATQLATDTCGKCDGVGYIRAFSHYANGVCFWCKGSGKISYKTESSVYKPSAIDAKRIEWLKAVQADRFNTISLSKLEEIDMWAHNIPGKLVCDRYWKVLRPIFIKRCNA